MLPPLPPWGLPLSIQGLGALAWGPRSPGERRLQEAGWPGFHLCHLVGAHFDEARSHKGQLSCWKPSFLSLGTASPSLIMLQPHDLSVPRSHHHFLPLLKRCPELKLKILPPPTPAHLDVVQAPASCSPLWWPFSRPSSPCCGLFWSSPRPEAGPHGTTGGGGPLSLQYSRCPRHGLHAVCCSPVACTCAWHIVGAHRP